MSSKLEPVIWLRVLVTLAYMKGRTDVRTYVCTYVRCTYVRTDVHDVMAIKPNFLTSMGYHIFLSMVLRARSSANMCSGGLKAIHCSFFLEHRETDPSPDAALCLCQLTAFSHRFWTRKTKVNCFLCTTLCTTLERL